MRKVQRIFAISALSLVCLAGSMQDRDKEQVTARGVVTNPMTGDLVSGATVSFIDINRRQEPLHTVTTGDDGRFVVERIAPAIYLVSVAKPGFVTPRGFEENDVPGSGRRLEVVAGDSPSNWIRLPLIRMASVSGQVLDADRMPIGSPTVVGAYEKGYSPTGQISILPVQGIRLSRTGKNGEYEISGLRPGEYIIRVYGADLTGGSRTIPSTYYPGVTSVDRATPILLSEGMSAGSVNVKLSPEPLFSVSMKLQSATELPPVTFEIIEPSGLGLSRVADEQGNGVYVLRNIPAGEYQVKINFRPDRPLLPYLHRIRVAVVDRDVDLGSVNVDSQVSISGKVLTSGGPLLPRIFLNSLDGVPLSAPLAQDGTFLLQKVSVGEYAVQVSFGPGQYVRSVRYGGRDIPGSLVIDGTSPGQLEIVVDKSLARVEGIVQNARGESVSFSRVVLMPEVRRRTDPNRIVSAVADGKGRFLIENLPPGIYSALGWTQTPPYAYKNQEFLNAFQSRVISFEALGGATSTLVVPVIEVPPK